MLAMVSVVSAHGAVATSRSTPVGRIRVASPRPLLAVNQPNQSNNWSGYNQGTLERGGTTFHDIVGTWTVPTATQHKAKEAEFSATWTGIGGGCIDANCTVTDSTLIQAGTEQDVDASGQATYSAWYELIPTPAITISGMTVGAGDQMKVRIHEVISGADIWAINVNDVSRGESFSTTVPYVSTHATAEWIEETPLIIGTGGTGLSALPNLSTVGMDPETVNGANPGLNSSEEIQLVGVSGNVLATPSAPDSDTDGFNVCTYASSCSPPGS
jgi:hypothetical protein